MSADPAKGSDSHERRRLAVQMTALGLEFSSAVIGGLVLGYYLDDWLGTEPWLLLVCTFGGLGTAVARLIALTRRFQRMRDAERR